MKFPAKVKEFPYKKPYRMRTDQQGPEGCFERKKNSESNQRLKPLKR